jgi:hypothetical protein
MPTIASPVELHAVEKRRQEELEEVRSIQNVMLPNQAWPAGSVNIWIPPGLFDPNVCYEALELPLEPGGSVLFFTDGLPDGFDAKTKPRPGAAASGVCGAGGVPSGGVSQQDICGREQICRRAS